MKINLITFLFILLFFPMLLNAQIHISLTSKEIKKVEKIKGFEMFKRNIDFTKTFVPYAPLKNIDGIAYTLPKIAEKLRFLWQQKLFEAGLEVGNYYRVNTDENVKKRESVVSNTIMFNGDYVVEIAYKTYPYENVITIKDLHDNNKVVGTISFVKKVWKQDKVLRNLIKYFICQDR